MYYIISEVTPDTDFSKSFITYLEMTIQAFSLRHIYVLPKYLLKGSHFNQRIHQQREKVISKIVTAQPVNKIIRHDFFFNLLTN